MPTMRTNHLIIGFGGALAAGKDTVAKALGEVLEETTDTPYAVIGMSDVLRDAIYVLNPIIKDPFENPSDEEIGLFNRVRWKLQDNSYVHYRDLMQALIDSLGTYEEAYTCAKRRPEVRGFLQRLGTEVGRDLLYQDVWVDVVAARAEKLAQTRNVLITGIRFPNEVEMMKKLSGVSVYVTRKNHKSSSTHSSELSVSEDDFDIVVQNDGTLENVKRSIAPNLAKMITAE